MTTGHSKAAEEIEIRMLMDDLAKAIRAEDVAGVVAHYAPDVLTFDVVNPLRLTGRDAVGRRLEVWFSSFRGRIGYELRDLSITAGDEIAFGHSLNHVSGTLTDGTKLDMWWRATVCYRKIDGRWMITHDHSSVPMDVASGRASVDLTP